MPNLVSKEDYPKHRTVEIQRTFFIFLYKNYSPEYSKIKYSAKNGKTKIYNSRVNMKYYNINLILADLANLINSTTTTHKKFFPRWKKYQSMLLKLLRKKNGKATNSKSVPKEV